MCFWPQHLGAGAKTRLHTPKAVTHHKQPQIIHHDRSQPWAYGIQNKAVYATLHLQVPPAKLQGAATGHINGMLYKNDSFGVHLRAAKGYSVGMFGKSNFNTYATFWHHDISQFNTTFFVLWRSCSKQVTNSLQMR